MKKQDKTPLISVCMITYNHEAYIGEAIEGVLMQRTTYPIKLIIGEDCSTDNTRAICEDYQQKHPDIIELLPKPISNLGMMPNLIRTLSACTGKYIAMCEGDDYWIDRDKLAIQVEYLNINPRVSLTYSYEYILENNSFKPNKISGHKTKADVLNGFIPPTRTMVFNNSPGLISFMASKQDEISGDKFLAYYQSTIGQLTCIERFTAVYRKTGTGVWSSISREQQIIIALTYYFNFRKVLNERTAGIHAIKRLTKHSKDIANWFKPRTTCIIYLKSIKSLLRHNFHIQAFLLIVFLPVISFKVIKKTLSHLLKQ